MEDKFKKSFKIPKGVIRIRKPKGKQFLFH